MKEFSWAVLSGGLALFFFGLQNARKGLQLIAGDNMKRAMARLTGNRFLAACFGGLVTLVLQSSSATTVMLVSFAATGLLTLKQSFGIILGADIGTTFVVILLSIKSISEYSLAIVAIGFFVECFSKKKKIQYFGSIILGFGLIFYGMQLMAYSMTPLRDSPAAGYLFQFLASHPIYNFIIATMFTALIHNSAATIAMVIALSFHGGITLETAIPIVFGANVGTCITALLSSLGMGVDGKRVAVAHVFIKTVGVAVAFPFIPQIAMILNKFWSDFLYIFPSLHSDVGGKIAAVHLLFNIAIVILFLPFIGLGARVVEKILPYPESEKEKFGPKYIDDRALESPTYALSQVRREIIRIAELVHQIYSRSITIFERKDEITLVIEDVESQDDKIDILDKAVRFYLAKLSQEQLSKEQSGIQMALLSITTDLEEIGDIMSKDLVALAQKKKRKAGVFSEEGWRDLQYMHSMVEENFKIMLSTLVSPSEELYKTIKRHEENMVQIEQELRQSHLSRLHIGLQDTLDTSSIHLDVMGDLRRINTKLTHIAKNALNLT